MVDFFYFLSNLKINEYQVIVIFWNIALAFFPLFLILKLREYQKKTKLRRLSQKFIALIFFLFWLIFAPNAAYLISDARHLSDFCQVASLNKVCLPNSWLIFFFFAYAAIGWVAFVLNLNQVKLFLDKAVNKKFSVLFIFLLVPLVSLGLLLGLIDRWNSWDIFLYPGEIFSRVAFYLTDKTYLKNWAIYTACLYFLYGAGNLVFVFRQPFFIRRKMMNKKTGKIRGVG